MKSTKVQSGPVTIGTFISGPFVSVLGKMVSSRIATSVWLAGLLCASSYSYAEMSDFSDTIEDLSVTVVAGDTYGGILSRELQSLDAWSEVANYNKLESPDAIKPGDVIVLPANVLRRTNYAEIAFLKGEAEHFRQANNDKSMAVKGDKVYAGDTITTKGTAFVTLAFNGGTTVNIQPDSAMRINVLKCIDKEEACEIVLESDEGQLSLDVKSRGFKSPTLFSIESPYASSAVRGTTFDFDVRNGNVMGVTEGKVEIIYNNASNFVSAGKGVLAGEGVSINDLYDLLPEPKLRLNADVNRVSSEDAITWEPIDGAVRYKLAYARSESMGDVVFNSTETIMAARPQLPTGTFYVSNRAVADNGLQGLVTKKKFLSVAIDESQQSPEISMSLSDDVIRVTAPNASGPVEVKVGNELVVLDEEEYLVGLEVYELQPGQSVEFTAEAGKRWYLQARTVINSTSVSPYGGYYAFDPQGR